MNARGAMTWVVGIVALVVIVMVIRNPAFKQMFSDLLKVPPLQSGTPSTTTPSTTTEPTATGEFPYPPTGSANELDDQGSGTRHYASGKPDDVTHEWEGSTSAQSYMVVMDITLTEIDHDDTISVKYGGTHNGSGWYDMGYSFESGQACAGKEENHPSTDLCEVTGNSIGNLVNTPVKIAAINIGKGEKLELWSNLGSGWTKDVETGPGVTGFRPSESEDEIQIRIDAAPGIEMRSAAWYEIQGTGTSTPGGEVVEAPGTEGEEGGGEEEEDDDDANLARVLNARALTARMARKKLYNTMYSRAYKARREEDGDFIPVNMKLRSLKYNKIGGL